MIDQDRCTGIACGNPACECPNHFDRIDCDCMMAPPRPVAVQPEPETPHAPETPEGGLLKAENAALRRERDALRDALRDAIWIAERYLYPAKSTIENWRSRVLASETGGGGGTSKG